MVAESRPTLRSSARKIALLEEVPPTNVHQIPQPNSSRGKRTRDCSPSSQSNASVKKQKPSPPKQLSSSLDEPTHRALKSLPLRGRPNAKNAVTSRAPIPPLQQFDDFSKTTNSTPTSHSEISPTEASRLTTNAASTLHHGDKRSLRSHDGGSRSKSELALYFPNYDELVDIEPKEPEFLTPNTLLYITDEPTKPKTTTTYSSSNARSTTTKSRSPSSTYPAITNGSSHILQWSEATFRDLNNATRLNLSSIDKSTRHQNDPMSDTLYLKAHRRAERQEIKLRNIEKERAMHEKVQLERLMDGLRGHDWLRVMGISGITDGEKKAYEPKRNYFIHEVRVLLKKFQEWKEEEKRRRVEKDNSMQDENEERESDEMSPDRSSDGDPPDYNDVDASAARQLHQEAVLATKARSGQKRSHLRKTPIISLTEKPFTSFYSKPYLREAAIGKHRRGRTRFAFGQPVAEPPDREFDLGTEILTPDTLAAQERKKRVMKRHGHET